LKRSERPECESPRSFKRHEEKEGEEEYPSPGKGGGGFAPTRKNGCLGGKRGLIIGERDARARIGEGPCPRDLLSPKEWAAAPVKKKKRIKADGGMRNIHKTAEKGEL